MARASVRGACGGASVSTMLGVVDRRLLLMVPLFLALGVVAWVAVRDPSAGRRHRASISPAAQPPADERSSLPTPPSPVRRELAATPSPLTSSLPSPSLATAFAVPVPLAPVVDKKLRAELRALLAAAPRPDAGAAGLDPGFVQERLHADLVPLLDGCQRAARHPGLTGTLVVKLSLAGLEREGTLVESAEVVRAASTLDDREIAACLRDGLLSVVMTPPPRSGVTALTYPFTAAASPPHELE